MDSFFHARTGKFGLLLAGYIRIAYGVLVLCDRLLLSVDFDYFFLSDRLPYPLAAAGAENTVNLFRVLPAHPASYIAVHVASLVASVLLILGVRPRPTLVVLYVCMLSFHFHNDLIWDGEDAMFRIWAALLLFLPIEAVSVSDGFGTRLRIQSWPMWPYRLFQLEICFIYIGAGLGKLSHEQWRSGDALRLISHTTDFFGGPVTPGILFERHGPLKLLSLSSLVLENTCWILIWPQSTRIPCLVAMILLHVGIDLAMNMHCFEWLTILGWLSFLVQPDDRLSTEKGRRRRYILSLVLCVLVLSTLVDTAPLIELFNVSNRPVQRLVRPLMDWKHSYVSSFLYPALGPIGLYQDVWNMFANPPDSIFTYEAQVRFANQTMVSWLSPDWSKMTWYEKKRWQRPMSFFDAFSAASPEVHDTFLRQLIKDEFVGDDVASVLLQLHTDEPVGEADGSSGFWSFVKKEYERSTTDVYTLNVCDDLHPSCSNWADNGACDFLNPRLRMLRVCRASCNFCPDVSDLGSGTRISVYWKEDENFFDATVRRQRRRSFLLDFDDYDTDADRFAWVSWFDLQTKLPFTLLADNQGWDKNEEGDGRTIVPHEEL